MSHYYFVHCRTCGDSHDDCRANHELDAMRAMVRHAGAIAALTDLVSETHGNISLIFFHGHDSRLDPSWFRHHLDHDLVVMDEYQRIVEQCTHDVECGGCGHRHHCTLALGHEGAHDPSPNNTHSRRSAR